VALANTTIRYGTQIAALGLEQAAKKNPGIMNGINIYMGKCVNKNVADSLALPYTPCDQAF
ncbi:MAG: alanine dehydrogenase, partial [Clostridia bacterium]|nr:alanine dehydrogenase [Clostridia bacterium]